MRNGLLCLVLLCSTLAFAETPEEKGLAIALEAERRDLGWRDMAADLEMQLKNKQGQESERRLRIRTLEVQDDGDKSLTVFDEPRDIAGTGLLSYTHALIPDDQWLYLPALKRVKRIASANKSGPFVGSEFAYEDLTSPEVKKYHYKWLRNETLNERETHVVEDTPAYEHSGYTRRVVWIDKTMFHPLKIEYFDRKNALLKTLVLSGHTQYLEQYWRPALMSMQNHQTGKSTELRWSNYVFQNGFTDRDFDQNTLKRSR